MININELKSLQDNITGFYSNFVSKKRVNKKDLIDLYINGKTGKSILLLNLKSELNNCEKGYNFLIQTLSYQNKKEIISAIKEIKKEYPEIYDGVLTGFKILIKMKYDVENREIYSDKVINELDKLVIDFINILNKHKVDCVIVSGYVSIVLGRSRATEDVDLLVIPLDFLKFKELFEYLLNNSLKFSSSGNFFDKLNE